MFARIARCHQRLGDVPAALAVCKEGLSYFAEDAELLFRESILHRADGHPAEAEETWRRILTLRRPQRFSSIDQAIYGHLTLRNLAALAAERGDLGEARSLWRRALEECPGDDEAMTNRQGLRE
jgi:tetratricopeptide (TPR) repeat protein